MPIAVLAALLFSWVLPDHFPPWLAFHTEVPAFVAAIIALVACLFSATKSVKTPTPIFFFLALTGSTVFQYWSGLITYGGDALVASMYIVAIAAAWLWGFQWAKSDSRYDVIESVSCFLVVISLLTSFQVLAQWLKVDDFWANWVLHHLPGARPRANIGQPNQAATALMMGSVALAVLRQHNRVSPLLMCCGILLLGFAITLTQSRTALLSAMVLVGMVLIIFHPNKGGALRRFSVLLWLFSLYAAAWVYPNFSTEATGAVPLTVDQMAAVGTRPLIWQQLVAGIYERPWAGWGWLQVPAAQQAGALLYPGAEQTNYAHNAILDLFIYVGIPAGCTALGLIGIWLWRRVSRLTASKDVGEAIFLLIPFLVHCLLEFPHAYAYFLVLVGLLLGAINAWTGSGDKGVVSIPRWLLAVFLAFWTILLLAIGYEYLQAEEDFRINRFENLRLGETPADYAPPRLLFLTQLEDLLRAMRLRAQPKMTDEELEVLVNSSKRYSWAKLQIRTALSLALNNRPDEATEKLQVIKSMFAADVYKETKETWLRLQKTQYPELAKVKLP